MSNPGTFPAAEEKGAVPGVDGWWQQLNRLDVAVYAAIATTPTPALDRVFRRLSQAADHWKLWLGSAAALAIAGGPRGRRAAVNGVASMAASSAVVNLALKSLWSRHRPDRTRHQSPLARHVPMPTSTSFPSGHAATATRSPPGSPARSRRSASPSTSPQPSSHIRASTQASTIPSTSSRDRSPVPRWRKSSLLSSTAAARYGRSPVCQRHRAGDPPWKAG